jgi:hypothetical protein
MTGIKEESGHLMESNLNILEAKVLEAVALIKELRSENARLAGRCADLEAVNAEFVDAQNRLNQELGETRQQAETAEVYEQKRKEIEDKVGDLLQKLEAIG